ncbi:aminotransferase class IV [Nonomuraea sediminis]|uniref:aminotransferase class IV n=1 Tax=Nonomuraea sediminis TaxID=2835864 RepID=UPI001BDC13A7|nr:aminotransferase class IV [Nonomuraea sediminis]
MIDRVAIDGRPAGAADLGLAVSARWGHFTAMQVRQGRVRALDLHLARLEAANLELFGEPLDTGLVLESIRQVLVPDASVRVYVVDRGGLHIVATAQPPRGWPDGPLTTSTYGYQRFVPHIKHASGFAQSYIARRFPAADEVLLTAQDGRISEGTISNLGCFDGERIVWPDAPMLRGITMQILERSPLEFVRRPLTAADLPGFPAVFLTNSWGVVAVGRVDDLALKVDEGAMGRVIEAFESTPWDPI